MVGPGAVDDQEHAEDHPEQGAEGTQPIIFNISAAAAEGGLLINDFARRREIITNFLSFGIVSDVSTKYFLQTP